MDATTTTTATQYECIQCANFWSILHQEQQNLDHTCGEVSENLLAALHFFRDEAWHSDQCPRRRITTRKKSALSELPDLSVQTPPSPPLSTRSHSFAANNLIISSTLPFLSSTTATLGDEAGVTNNNNNSSAIKLPALPVESSACTRPALNISNVINNNDTTDIPQIGPTFQNDDLLTDLSENNNEIIQENLGGDDGANQGGEEYEDEKEELDISGFLANISNSDTLSPACSSNCSHCRDEREVREEVRLYFY